MRPTKKREVDDTQRMMYPHQKSVVDHLKTNHGVIALHSTGAGKTLTSIASAKALLRRGTVQRIIALVNKSIIGQYKAEVARVDPKLVDAFDVMTVHAFRRVSRKDLAECMLIVDEAHHYNNVKGVTTQAILNACKVCPRVLLLTGTLYTNTLYDIAPCVAMVRGEDPMPRKMFNDLVKNEGETFLKRFLEGCVSVFMIDKNADPHYPKVAEHIVPIKMSPSTRKSIAAAAAGPFLIGERRFALGECGAKASGKDLAMCCEKCAWILDRLPRWVEKGEKTVFFTSFVDGGVRVLQKLINNIGINCAVVEGSTSAKSRSELVKIFNRPRKPEKPGFDEDADTEEEYDEEEEEEEENAPRNVRVNRNNVCGSDNALFYRENLNAYDTKKKKTPKYVYRRSKTDKKFKPTPDEMKMTTSTPIPPMWTPGVVCKDRSKLLWAASDSKGRWQRRYSQKFVMLRERKKMRRLLHMDQAFWNRYHKKVDGDLAKSTWTKDKLHAAALTLMRTCAFRPGGGPSKHVGVVTILKKHVTVTGTNVSIAFIGKSAKRNVCNLSVCKKTRDLLVELTTRARTGDTKIFQGITASSLRTYAAQLSIRPKDFRTYYANSALVELLVVDHTKPIKKAALSKTLRAAMQTISAHLNNTPGVAKSSYTFGPIWMYYMMHPLEFENILEGAPSNSTADRLRHLLQTLDWKRVYADYLDNPEPTMFEGDTPVLIITSAGAESIDLKGVRHVVFLNSTWTQAMDNQIVGRAQRYDSHAELPPSQRTVDVWKLLLRDEGGGGKGADEIMNDMVSKKKVEADDVYRIVASVSITAPRRGV